jgi:epoxyqueuosine reductase
MQLAAAFTDMPCSSDPWREPEVMGRCASCGACVRSCPTGAIGEDRILLHVDRCLTFFNEDEAEFPEWIDPAWHNSAIGCMRCQEACPGNAPLAACIEDREGFSETETEAILRGAPLEQLPNGTASRLAGLGLNAGYEILSRNLSAVIESFLMR